MRITFVIPYFYPAWQYGGQPRSAFELARGLVRRGHIVQVLTTDSGGASRLADIPRNQKRVVDGIEVYYYSNISNALAYRQRIFWPSEFVRRIDERLAGTDILHIHELRATTSVVAYRASQRAKIPYVVSPHGGLKHLGKKLAKTAFDALWGKRILENAAAVIGVSPVEEGDAHAFGVEMRRIRRLPNGIDVQQFRDLPAPEAFRARWRLGPGKIVLFLGRLHRVKGADVLLDAFKTAQDKEPGIQLVIAGPDDGQASELHRRVNATNMNSAVTFTGFLDETQKREALTGSCVLVLPSRSEVFALSAIESLACGTPVIMSSACGLYPLPGAEHGVILFENENRKDLAEKLLMMAGPTPFRHNVAAGRDFVLREFSSDAIAAKAEAIYKEILLRHG